MRWVSRRRFLAGAAVVASIRVRGAAAGARRVEGAPAMAGGTLNVNSVTRNSALDPVANTHFSTQTLAGYVYSRLFRFDAGLDPRTSLSRYPVPDLVQAYEIPDPTTYILKLRGNATFHAPLSRPAVSLDVLASFQRFSSEPKNGNRDVFSSLVDRIDTPDANTVVFRLQQPYAPFLNRLANPQYLWILSQEAADGSIDPAAQPVGTGPWLWQAATQDAYYLARNPDYFIAGLPDADAVVVHVQPSIDVQATEFAAGNLDVLNVSPPNLPAVLAAVPGANATRYIGNMLPFLFFGNRGGSTLHDFTADTRVRLAASVALDREALVSLIYGGQGDWANLINPGLGAWWLDPRSEVAGSSGEWFRHDVQKAKQLLTAAGYAGEQLAFIYANDAYGVAFNRTADAVRGMLAAAGLNVRDTPVGYLQQYIGADGIFQNGGPPNSIVSALQSAFLDPDDYLFGMLSRDGNRNHSHVSDGNLEELVRAERGELEPGARLDLVYVIQRLQAARMYYVPLVNGTTNVVTQPRVENFYLADDYGAGTESYAYLTLDQG